MNGEIKSIITKKEGRNGGYGFIKDEEGRDRFFHANDLVDLEFGEIYRGQRVEFTPTSGSGRNGSGNNLRAEQVKRQ